MESASTKIAVFTEEIGRVIKDTGMDFLNMQTITYTEDSGLKIKSTERVSYFNLLMIPIMIILVRNTDFKDLQFLMSNFTLGNSKMIQSMAWDRCSFTIMISSKAIIAQQDK